MDDEPTFGDDILELPSEFIISTRAAPPEPLPLSQAQKELNKFNLEWSKIEPTLIEDPPSISFITRFLFRLIECKDRIPMEKQELISFNALEFRIQYCKAELERQITLANAELCDEDFPDEIADDAPMDIASISNTNTGLLTVVDANSIQIGDLDSVNIELVQNDNSVRTETIQGTHSADIQSSNVGFGGAQTIAHARTSALLDEDTSNRALTELDQTMLAQLVLYYVLFLLHHNLESHDLQDQLRISYAHFEIDTQRSILESLAAPDTLQSLQVQIEAFLPLTHLPGIVISHEIQNFIEKWDLCHLQELERALQSNKFMLAISEMEKTLQPKLSELICSCQTKLIHFLHNSTSRLCTPFTQIDLVTFAFQKWGRFIKSGNATPSDDLVGEVLLDSKDQPIGLRGYQKWACQRVLTGSIHQRHCKNCIQLYDKVRNAKNYANSSAKKNIQPRLSSLTEHQAQLVTNQLAKRIHSLLAEKNSLQADLTNALDTFGLPVEKNTEIILLQKLIHAFSEDWLKPDHFLFEQLQNIAMVGTTKDGRGFRWKPDTINFCQTILFRGHQATLQTLRGQAFTLPDAKQQTSGHLPVDVSRFNLALPAPSTVKKYLPVVELDPKLTMRERITKIFKTIFSQSTSSPCKAGIISFDELIHQHGYCLDTSRNLLVGSDGTLIPVKDLLQKNADGSLVYSDEWLRTHEAKGVYHFFFTTLDGLLSFSICWIAVRDQPIEKIEKNLREFRTMLDEIGFKTIGFSSDGFASSVYLANKFHQEVIKKKHDIALWIFDYTHVIKLLRNCLLKPGFTLKNGHPSISMKELVLLWQQYPQLASQAPGLHLDNAETLIKIEEMMPTDKMNWENVKKLFYAIKPLRNLKSSEMAQDIAEYLENMEEIYNAFKFDEEDKLHLEERIQIFQKACSWFTWRARTDHSHPSISNELYDMLKITERSLQELLVYEKQQMLLTTNSTCSVYNNISFLATLIVENYFSTLRQHAPYPTIWDYAVHSTKSQYELYKRLAMDNRVTYPQKFTLGKAYGLVTGLKVTMKDLEILFPTAGHPSQKAELTSKIAAQNQGGLEQITRSRLILANYGPSRRTLSLRQSVAKDKIISTGTIFLCPVAGCPEYRTYEACFRKHLSSAHPKKYPPPSLPSQILSSAPPQSKSTAAPLAATSTTKSPPKPPVPDGNAATTAAAAADHPSRSSTTEVESMRANPIPQSVRLTDIHDASIFVIDTETTGRKGQQIVELYCRDLTTNRRFCTLVKPLDENGNQVTISAHVPHKITNVQLQNARVWKEVWAEFLSWVSQSPSPRYLFIGYNLSFDRAALNRECEKANTVVPNSWLWADIMELALEKLQLKRNEKGHKLSDVSPLALC